MRSAMAPSAISISPRTSKPGGWGASGHLAVGALIFLGHRDAVQIACTLST